MDIKYSIVDKLFFDNWIKSNPTREGVVFGLFSFESDSLEELTQNIKQADKTRAKKIVNAYKSQDVVFRPSRKAVPTENNLPHYIEILDNSKCIVKYEKLHTNSQGQTSIKVLDILDHHNESLEKYLVLV